MPKRKFDPFEEIGKSGIYKWDIKPDEFRRELQGQKGIKTRREMATSPQGAAINRIIGLAYRRMKWRVIPGGDAPVDEEAATFLESCIQDLNIPWEQVITQIALNTNEQGWSIFEIVYKKRLGDRGDSSISKFDDGRIGWRKFSLRPASTIDDWLLDEHGGWDGIIQVAPPNNQRVEIPKEKLLLFRLEDKSGSPQGSGGIFDPAYRAYYFIRELETIEGIVEERMGGVLTINLPEGANDDPNDTNSDFSKAKEIVVNFRVDEQMGLVLPHGFEANLWSPGEGARRIQETIARHEANFFRAALAQWLLLGAKETGSWALSKDQTDIFLMALSGWLGNYKAVLNGVAVPRLMALNSFPGMTALPQLEHTPISRRDIQSLAQALFQLAQAGWLLPRGEQDEIWIREELEAPPLEVGEKPEPASQLFAELPEKRPGRTGYIQATNIYQRELEGNYQIWYRNLARELDRAKPEEREGMLMKAMDDLFPAFDQLGRQRLLEAFLLGLGDVAPTPEALQELAETIQENSRYLQESFIPAVREKAQRGLQEGVLEGGTLALEGLFATMLGRIAQYAGAHWANIWRGAGHRLAQEVEEGKEPRVKRVLNPLAEHCASCMAKVGEYPDYWTMKAQVGVPGDGSDDCHANCRCHLEIWRNGGWERL